MLLARLLCFIAVLTSIAADAQQLSPAERQIAVDARRKYYSLQGRGFDSLACQVDFDLATVPLLPTAKADPVRKLVESTTFALTLDQKGRPTVRHRSPGPVDRSTQNSASTILNLLTSFVTGLFQTWPTKGLYGPIPPFDSDIRAIFTSANGYEFRLAAPGAPVTVSTDKNYLVTTIVSGEGHIQEFPTFTPTPEGLVFTGTHAIDNTVPTARVDIVYDLQLAVNNGLRIPAAARVRVNDNIDVKFALTECLVRRAQIIYVNPPTPEPGG